MMLIRAAATLCAAVVLAVWGVSAADGAPAQEEPFRVYLDPNGSDANGGLSPESAVKTLARAQRVVKAANPAVDVEVRIKQGSYVTPQTTWDFTVPGRTVSFMPVNYVIGTGEPAGGRPLFRGNGTLGWWLKAYKPGGGEAGYRFYYLKVENYSSGLIIAGGTRVDSRGLLVPADPGVNGNTVFGMMFNKIGSKHLGSGAGFAGVELVNSSNNLIQNNHFLNLENLNADGRIHATYIAHHSNNNVIRNNRLRYISGDPIRVRNDSNRNDVFGNDFNRTGEKGQYTDWFCDTVNNCSNPPDKPRECASHGNLFHENVTGTGYDGGAIPDWAMIVGGIDYAGGSDCTNEGEKRVRTWGNT